MGQSEATGHSLHRKALGLGCADESNRNLLPQVSSSDLQKIPYFFQQNPMMCCSEWP